MKSMKGLNVNRMLGSVRRRATSSQAEVAAVEAAPTPTPQNETPEAAAARGVKLFCESGGPPNNSGEEVLYLPTIVEAAESSPAAAKECAQSIKKFLKKDNMTRPYVQYNAIMLMRILADNPGATFTRNLDKQFADTVKELLRYGRDPSVKQILMETMDNFEREKKEDTNLKILMEMWKKEQEKMAKVYSKKGIPAAGPRPLNAPPFDAHSQNYFSRSHSTNRGLPGPMELASRIEEARTSAKLLTQLVQSTPPTEFLNNDLLHEFADRCQSASRSIQGYIVAHDPSPDNDTMLTLIETNDQLALAISKHQRAVLQSRRALGMGTDTPSPSQEGFAPPPGPPPNNTRPLPGVPPQQNSSKPVPQVPSRKSVPPPAGSSDFETKSSGHPEVPPSQKPEDPFQDPKSQSAPQARAPAPPTEEFGGLGMEPYHPGFNSTQSYVGRQENATGNVTMHAAAPERDRDSEEEDDYAAPQQTRKAPIYRY